MTKGPLGRVTMGFLIFVLFFCLSLLLFAYISIERDREQTEIMQGDVPAIVELYNSFINYPNFASVEFTQDGEVTLLDSELAPIGTMKITNEAQVEVLENVEKIYRDDYGVNFLYGNNYFSSISRILFSQQSIEDIKNKRSDNEVVTKISGGMYMIVYSFEYDRFISPEEIGTVFGEFAEMFFLAVEEFI